MSQFNLPPEAHQGREKEETAGRRTLLEWKKKLSKTNQLALGVEEEGVLWIAERVGDAVEVSRPSGEVRSLPAPLSDPEHPEWSLPRLVGKDLLIGTPEGLRLGDRIVVEGLFQCYDGARSGESCVLLASGAPKGQAPGTYWIHWLPGDASMHMERLGEPASGVSVHHTAERIGLAWADEQGIHTLSLPLLERSGARDKLISYYAPPTERYTSPSVAVDQTGKAYALFYVFSRKDEGNEAGDWTPTREMQLNFERIAFKASAAEDGYFPVNVIHRKRIYMIYGLKPTSTTARWRVPGTTMWDGAEHIPGSWPASCSDGKSLYVATDAGLWAMGGGQAEEGLDLLSHSWASPEGDVGPQNTWKARFKRWFGF